MAKFLDTTGVSYHLQQLINGSNEKLILISPYLKISDRLKQSLADKDRMKIDIRIIYGKGDLEPAEHNWLKSLHSTRTSFCQNLHAKCYLNEKEAIITSISRRSITMKWEYMSIRIMTLNSTRAFTSKPCVLSALVKKSRSPLPRCPRALIIASNRHQHFPDIA